MSCTDCHGGNAQATSKTDAHVQPKAEWLEQRKGYLKNLSVNELNAVSSEYLQFINPGDYRVATMSCGQGSPENPGSGCHQNLVDSAPRSVMATFVGHFNVPRFQAGMQDRSAEIGSQAVESLFPDEPLPKGAVARLDQALPPEADAPRDAVSTLMDHYLTKNCTHCHQNSFGRNDARGNFRSSGCTSCHMLYSNDGLSESKDPSAQKDRPPHPIRHELTTAIGVEQCEHCHFQGARIGLHYRGLIEWGFEAEPPLPPLGEQLHGHDSDFYLIGGDKYPADLHYTAGLSCADCHIGRDVHGDGRIYSTAKFQVAIRCENCHGNVDEDVAEGSARAPLLPGGSIDPECQPETGERGFYNCAGDELKRLSKTKDGTVLLALLDGSRTLPVPQIHSLIEAGNNPSMNAAMGRAAGNGASHTESVECTTCHTAYQQYCFGCHVSMDYGVNKKDGMSGNSSPGNETTNRDFTSLDLFFVGQNRRGKIGAFCPSMQVFTEAVGRDKDGEVERYFNDRIRTSKSGKKGFNWAIDTPHAVSRRPQPCTICHADESNDCDIQDARRAFGFGTGRYLYTDENGTEHDLTQLLAEDGTPVVDFSHEGQSEVPEAMRERMTNICVPPR